MKKLLLSIVVLGFLGGGTSRAGITLGTTNPQGTPLDMSAGTTSGPMLVNIVSNNPPNDLIAGWQFQLMIMPEMSASGTLAFQDPATSTPANPANYIFGSNGFGISAMNSGTMLSANDFTSDGSGVSVPGSPGANLLQLSFLASSGASGLFDIDAVEGTPNTVWTDSNGQTQYFSNVPNGTDMVLIGQVLITPAAVPEPSSIWMMFSALGLGGASLAGWKRRPRQAGKSV